MRKIALIAGGVVLVLIVAVLVAPSLIDWNAFKPQIAAVVQEATGRDFHIDGNLVIKLIPSAQFSAGGIRLSNAPGTKTADMVKVGNIEAEIELWPLLAGTLVVDRLVISEPEVKSGDRRSWQTELGIQA